MNSNIGCLLIHGFAGNRAEIESLASYLNRNGIFTLCTELPGHSGLRSDLR